MIPENEESFHARTKGFLNRFRKAPLNAVSIFLQNRKSEAFNAKLARQDTSSTITEIKVIDDTADARKIEREYSDLEQALRRIAENEASRKSVPFANGVLLTQYLNTNEGFSALIPPLEQARHDHPQSIFLTYLLCLSLAKCDRVDEANEIITKALTESRNTIKLMKIWRVIDSIARDNMSWLGGGDGTHSGYDLLPFIDTDQLNADNTLDGQLTIMLAEPLLQGKHQEAYLAACQTAFIVAENLAEKLRAISAVLRQGLRRIPDYHSAYQLGHDYFDKISPQLQAILDASTSHSQLDSAAKSPVQIAQILRMALKIAKELERQDDILEIEAALQRLATSENGKDAIWLCALALLEHNPSGNLALTSNIIATATRLPKTVAEIHDYLNWCIHAQEYEAADAFASQLKHNLIRTKIGLAYAKVLQRLGQFHKAANIAKICQAAMLVAPHKMCPYTTFSSIKRVGELTFAAETADIYSLVQQPTSPKGVILVTIRGLEQLRRTPIVVLMELKRMGWAVIPVAQGVLPLEKTGIHALDQYLGCITPNRELSLEARHSFTPAEPVNFIAEKGKIFWKELDLSHALWEEAAANRRQYDIDYTCPAVQHYLGNAVKWTQLCTEILENIKETSQELNLRTASLIQFNHRLPDAIWRFYCEEYGDAENFFCIHSANGYQNYFANFSTNVSTKGIMRNMTRHPETRSGSFPVPADFQAYFEEHESLAPIILNQVKGITKVKRSTEGQKAMPEDAKQALERIMTWRKNGGKVACAFGKVVCDSGVPYDGGPAHANMKEWLNHTIESVRGSNTLLILKPHPHEYKEQIACFLNQYFFDLIDTELPENVILSGHRWFDINDLQQFVDLGLIYNGTTSVELGVLGIPSILCSHFAPIDYPVGHATPTDKADYEAYVRFEKEAPVDPKLQERSACWLQLMGSNGVTLDYRYHARQITNKVLYPSWWFKDDIRKYLIKGDPAVTELAKRAIS